MIQSPGLQFPTSGVQVQPLTVAPRLDRPDKTLRLMVKAALISPEHLKNLHTYKEKRREKKEENNNKSKYQKRKGQ